MKNEKPLKTGAIQTLLLLLLCLPTFAQLTETQKLIDDLNRSLDRAVVAKDILTLEAGYAEDFVFTHGTGLVDSKESWIKNIQKIETKFISREHDSTHVEMHAEIAILTGILTVTRDGKDGIAEYGLKYVRVYALRKKVWQLISHRTVKEWHE